MLSNFQKKLLDFAYNYYEQNHTSKIVYKVSSSNDLPHIVHALNMLMRDEVVEDVDHPNFNTFTFTLTNPEDRYKG